jgi:hypothetical protein
MVDRPLFFHLLVVTNYFLVAHPTERDEMEDKPTTQRSSRSTSASLPATHAVSNATKPNKNRSRAEQIAHINALATACS